MAAVQDRGHLVFLEPSAEEIHFKVAEWFWDHDINDWFADHPSLIPNPSMRNYARASELKRAGLDWVKVLLADSVPEQSLLIARIKSAHEYADERSYVEAFMFESAAVVYDEAQDGSGCPSRSSSIHQDLRR